MMCLSCQVQLSQCSRALPKLTANITDGILQRSPLQLAIAIDIRICRNATCRAPQHKHGLVGLRDTRCTLLHAWPPPNSVNLRMIVSRSTGDTANAPAQPNAYRLPPVE